jgi:Rrf2 family transcriptional regulator, nitric oxide-sensitive transcriptional repressor
MQLSLHSDYALRVLLYLGAHPERNVSTQEIATAYGISKHHLVRVVQTLAERGYVRAAAGRSGGVSLAMAPSTIRLGDVVLEAEPNLRLVECFDAAENTCPISGVCRLEGVLRQALSDFVASLNQHTLADLLARGARRRLADVFVSISPPRTALPVRL